MREMRVSLDADDFKKLVAGETIKKEGSAGAVAIGLQDIGYGVILAVVTDAYNKFLDRPTGGKDGR